MCFGSCGSWALEHRLSACGTQAQLFRSIWNLLGPGIEPFLATPRPLLQGSCLENPMDRGAWQATVFRVAESELTETTYHACTFTFFAPLVSPARYLSISSDFYKNQHLFHWFFSTAFLFSISLIYALISIISFLLLDLDLHFFPFPSFLNWKFRLFLLNTSLISSSCYKFPSKHYFCCIWQILIT